LEGRRGRGNRGAGKMRVKKGEGEEKGKEIIPTEKLTQHPRGD